MQQHTKPWGAMIMAGVVAMWVGWVMPAVAKFRAPVERTGQERCFDTDGNVDPSCSEPVSKGQDGDIQAGVPFPRDKPRFTANVDLDGDGDCTAEGETCDGTVTDNLTGLIWLKDAVRLGGRKGLTWRDALAKVASLNRGEVFSCAHYNPGTFYKDWRLPNIKELQSLIHFGGRLNPALPKGHPFVGFVGEVPRFFYWSSTTRVDQVYKAWGVDLEEGKTIAHFKSDGICDATTTTTSFGVWAVRGPVLGGPFAPAPVEDTGQTQCWYPNDTRCPINEITCKDPNAKGQDGQLLAGVQFPTRRFYVNGDGTVLDTLTGLIWLQNAGCLGSRSWEEALDVVAVLNWTPRAISRCRDYTGTFNDWRLPNVKELQSLIDFGHFDPALSPEHPFTGVATFYHSSTTRERFPDDAWAVSLKEGITHPEPTEGGPATANCQDQDPPPCVCSRFTEPEYLGGPDDLGRCAVKHEGRHVWPVRGGIR
jgi:hypothetical protein